MFIVTHSEADPYIIDPFTCSLCGQTDCHGRFGGSFACKGGLEAEWWRFCWPSISKTCPPCSSSCLVWQSEACQCPPACQVVTIHTNPFHGVSPAPAAATLYTVYASVWIRVCVLWETGRVIRNSYVWVDKVYLILQTSGLYSINTGWNVEEALLWPVRTSWARKANKSRSTFLCCMYTSSRM